MKQRDNSSIDKILVASAVEIARIAAWSAVGAGIAYWIHHPGPGISYTELFNKPYAFTSNQVLFSMAFGVTARFLEFMTHKDRGEFSTDRKTRRRVGFFDSVKMKMLSILSSGSMDVSFETKKNSKTFISKKRTDDKDKGIMNKYGIPIMIEDDNKITARKIMKSALEKSRETLLAEDHPMNSIIPK